MSIYHVDATQIAAAATSTTATADNIRSSVAAMMSQLTGLQATWGGAAAASFQEVIAQWQATQMQVEASLDAVANALGAASTTYTDAESAATALFSGA